MPGVLLSFATRTARAISPQISQETIARGIPEVPSEILRVVTAHNSRNANIFGDVDDLEEEVRRELSSSNRVRVEGLALEQARRARQRLVRETRRLETVLNNEWSVLQS